jgi:hypothetical protein
MQVGDLVKIKYDGVVGLITEVETIQTYPHSGEGSWTTSPYWIHLLGQPEPFKPETLEVINASR